MMRCPNICGNEKVGSALITNSEQKGRLGNWWTYWVSYVGCWVGDDVLVWGGGVAVCWVGFKRGFFGNHLTIGFCGGSLLLIIWCTVIIFKSIAQEWHLSSWKSSDDPAQGDFSFWCDPQGYPQLILRNGSIELHRSRPWNGLGFNGRPNLKPNSIYKYGLVFTEEEVYYGYELINNSVVSRFALSHNGIVQRFTWIDRTQEWVPYLSTPTNNCDYYKRCGSYCSCNVENIPVCGSLSNFVPKYPKEWENGD
ncbi:G-type lectin S-receptor-like serine/threonine-protein kinase At4g27290 [Camellia sinensis]|uniref:G-type lectin S-receptor-like serine/threonine-protein kinase At4g27290 n=1 Tax=Camellia sinensis TaxID=4442 RepID=UPI001035B13E|nr:G-type lectin S-receptor-like serine/threonine-protein kinase At4g27290 [Camellia sinensis]